VVAGRPMTRARLAAVAAAEMVRPRQARRPPPATARPSPPLPPQPQPQPQQQPTPPQQQLQPQPPHQQQPTPTGGATTTTTTTSADGVGAGAAAAVAAAAAPPASTAPRVTHLSPGDIAALAAYVGPLALAHGERELGAFVVGGGEDDGGELQLKAAASSSSSSSPQLAGDVARCFCAVGLLLGKLGGEASARANWRAFVQRPGALALGLGLSFTSVTRFEQVRMMTADTLAAAADDVAQGTVSLVLWVVTGAASASGSRFRLHYGSSSCVLRHGTMLIVPPCTSSSSSESGRGGLRGVRVVEVEGDGSGGEDGGNDDDQQQLIALHFFVNRRVLDACASLGVQAVHAIVARGLA